jgi:transposase
VEAFLDGAAAMPLPGPLRSLIAPLLAVMLPLNRQLAHCDEVIDHLAAHDPRVQRLRTVPSIGPITAAAFVAPSEETDPIMPICACGPSRRGMRRLARRMLHQNKRPP